jgi:ubiquinone/menaquinone biosynthesis C-methylase UbiE
VFCAVAQLVFEADGDCQGGEKMVCEAYRVLKPGGIAWFGMVNRETATYVVKHVKPEEWWKGVAKRCGFTRYYTTREWSEWRMAAQPTPRYHAYLYKE